MTFFPQIKYEVSSDKQAVRPEFLWGGQQHRDNGRHRTAHTRSLLGSSVVLLTRTLTTARSSKGCPKTLRTEFLKHQLTGYLSEDRLLTCKITEVMASQLNTIYTIPDPLKWFLSAYFILPLNSLTKAKLAS